MAESKRLAVIFALVSMITAFIAAALFMNYVQKTEENLTETVEVIAAAREIPAMSKITEDMVSIVRLPKNLAAANYVTAKDVINKTTLVKLSPREIINTGILMENTDLPPECRVIQLRPPMAVFDDEFRYGDQVDIIVSYKENDLDKSETLLKGVTVVNYLSSGEGGSLGIVLNTADIEKVVWMLNFGKEVRVIKATI